MDFVRATRLPTPHIDVGDVDVAGPPDLPKPSPANPLARLLPVAMVVAGVGMMALYFTSGMGVARNPMFVLFPVMMLVSALGSLAYGARGGQRSAELDEDRRDYLGYLDVLDASAARTADAQRRSLWWSHPDPSALWTLVGGPRMWERRPGDADYVQLRVGLGGKPLSTPLVAPELDSGQHDPVTHMALQHLLAARSAVTELPVTIDLPECPVVVVEGDTSAARALVRAMVCQLAVFHGPSDVSVAAVVDGSSASEWDWLKWLPHHRSSLTTDAAGPARMTHRSMRQVTATTAKRVLVIVDAALAQEHGHVPEGMTVVTVGAAPGAMETLPRVRIDCSGDAFPERPDALTAMQAEVCARRLAPFREGADDATTTPGTWAQLTGIPDPELASPELLWQPRAVERLLRVPIGVDDQGDPVELDIKEAAHGGTGPHGLCVGATGSGKSEFLRTLTLGLVATHPPEALNLVLVDFKGGATFLGFERLRHVAAVITNLADEAHLVARMRDALAGELTRRQELLRAAGNFANVTAYEAARTHGAAFAPLPTLFIVVDEFSELLTQHPDFVELFVAIGRVGRSLGMHLLLASQRLEEGRLRGLESHLSYRICLKTFSAAESRAVLGTTAAFELPNTPGGAYLKNASGELVRFRTAFVSGPMAAAHRSDSSRRSVGVPTLFTAAPVGRVHKECPPAEAGPRSVLDTMLDRLAEAGTRAHQVWLPPLAVSPTLGAVLADASPAPGLVVPIGLVDNPFQQRRDVLLADLRGAGGHVAVVGGPRSGKSTTVRTLILALAATHDPAAVQVYGLDFGGGTLSAVRSLPHVGAVAGRFDRELVGRIVAHLQAVVRRREAQLRTADIRQHGEVFLVIDGWAGVRQEFDGLEEAITAIAAQGLSVGVHVVIAASRWAELRPALKDQLGTRIELRLGDPADSELDRKRARLLAERPAGHGITREGLELVVALPRLDAVATAHGLDDALRAAADELRLRHRGLTAPEVVPMPTRVAYEGVVAHSPAHVVLGLGGDELRPMAIDFTESLHALILGEPQCGKTSALRTLCRELVRINDPGTARLVVVDLRRTLLGVVETEHLGGYAMSVAAAEAHVADLAVQLTARLPDAGVTQRQLRERSWWSGPDMYVVVDDYELVAGVARNPLTPLLELLPHARDLGLHVIIARRAGGAARAMFDPVLTGLRDVGCLGLMMSASPDEGVLLGSVRPSALPQGRATMIRRGHPDQLVQVAWTDPP